MDITKSEANNNKNDQSIENLLANITSNKPDTKSHEWGIKDFNNIETADRKLIVNKKFEFWVHDEALSTYSDYFSEIFGKSILLENANVENETTDEDYKKTDIQVPYEEHIFDVLLWIYTKDSKRLKKSAKSFHPLLFMISLGIHLKMKPEYFEILLTKLNFSWKIEFFSDPMWSKTIFTFPILERIVDEMKANNFTKIIALLSWLKEIDSKQKKVIDSKETIEEILTSIDLFLVRNYIKTNNLMSGLIYKEISELTVMFPNLHSAFDTSTVIKEYAYASGKKLVCIICKKEFSSPFEVIQSLTCAGDPYHPKNFVTQRIEKNNFNCLHDGCSKKISKTELSCCHRPFNSAGCTLGEGRHLIIIEN